LKIKNHDFASVYFVHSVEEQCSKLKPIVCLEKLLFLDYSVIFPRTLANATKKTISDCRLELLSICTTASLFSQRSRLVIHFGAHFSTAPIKG